MSVGGSSGPAAGRSYTQDTVAQFDGASITDGAVGADIAALTIHAGQFTVHASIKSGRYTAWWPGPAYRRAPLPPSGRGGLNLPPIRGDMRYEE